MDIEDEIIHPRLKSEEVRELVTNPNNTLPIHYGVQMKNNENIREVIVKYKYLGIIKSKKFEL